MKFRPNKRYNTIAVYAFLVIAAAILFNEAIKNFSVIMSAGRAVVQFIQPVVYGFVFAYLLNPMLRMYDDRLLVFVSRGKMKKKPRRVIGLLLTYPTMLLILFLFFRLVIPQMLVSIDNLFRIVPRYTRLLNTLYTDILDSLNNFQLLNDGTELATLLESVNKKLIGSLESLIESAYEYVTGMIPQLFTAGARFTSGLINLLLGIIISIYFLLDREMLFAQCRKIADALFPERVAGLLHQLILDTNRVFSGFIIGKIIDSAIIGVLCFVCMSLMRMPYAVLISVIVGVTNVIPYFGPFIGAIPGILIIFIVDPLQALWFAIFMLLLQQFDGNILGPKILGDTTGLSALWVIFAIMLFSGIFGILGMFIGVPLFAVIYTVVKRIVSYMLARKGKSTNTRDYASDKNPLIK